MNISLSPFEPENLVLQHGFDSLIQRQPTHLHTQAECGAYLRDSSRVPRRRPFIYLKPPFTIGSVPSLSGHAIAYRSRSLPRVHRHRASKPQGSFKRVLPWQVTMCVCVVFSSHPFWTSSSLDVPAGVTQEEGHTGFLIHLPSAVRALIFVARRIQPFLSLVDREVEFCVLTN